MRVLLSTHLLYPSYDIEPDYADTPSLSYRLVSGSLVFIRYCLSHIVDHSDIEAGASQWKSRHALIRVPLASQASTCRGAQQYGLHCFGDYLPWLVCAVPSRLSTIFLKYI